MLLTVTGKRVVDSNRQTCLLTVTGKRVVDSDSKRVVDSNR